MTAAKKLCKEMANGKWDGAINTQALRDAATQAVKES